MSPLKSNNVESTGSAAQVDTLATTKPEDRAGGESAPAGFGESTHASSIEQNRAAYRVAKRTLDVAVAAIALVLAAPVMAAIAVAIRLESSGPMLFGHLRLGQGGKTFRCLKFRSMEPQAHETLQENVELRCLYEENDFKVPLELDDRITKVGRFLRKSSLDELPQLINVIRGDMSLVGPRPIVPEELRWYGRHAALFLSVKPGITGVWQIQGRSRITYPERTQVELKAIASRSFVGDLKILAKSVPAVIMARGSL